MDCKACVKANSVSGLFRLDSNVQDFKVVSLACMLNRKCGYFQRRQRLLGFKPLADDGHDVGQRHPGLLKVFNITIYPIWMLNPSIKRSQNPFFINVNVTVFLIYSCVKILFTEIVPAAIIADLPECKNVVLSKHV